LFWNETGERKGFGPDIPQEAEKQVRMVRENLRVTQSRQRSYGDHGRRELSFEVRDFVYHKVSSMRGLRRFKVCGKLAPRFIGPFKIQEKRGEIAYQLELPPQLSDVHDIFHVSQLKKGLRVPEEKIPMEDFGCQGTSFLSRVPCQYFRDVRESYTEQEDQGVQGATESPH
jgi:hypothetical protein